MLPSVPDLKQEVSRTDRNVSRPSQRKLWMSNGPAGFTLGFGFSRAAGNSRVRLQSSKGGTADASRCLCDVLRGQCVQRSGDYVTNRDVCWDLAPGTFSPDDHNVNAFFLARCPKTLTCCNSVLCFECVDADWLLIINLPPNSFSTAVIEDSHEADCLFVFKEWSKWKTRKLRFHHMNPLMMSSGFVFCFRNHPLKQQKTLYNCFYRLSSTQQFSSNFSCKTSQVPLLTSISIKATTFWLCCAPLVGWKTTFWLQ